MSTQAMLEVLERAADDIAFYSQLAQYPQVVLKDLDLTLEEKAALISGDVRFIESRIGRKLDEKLMKKVLIPLLSGQRGGEMEFRIATHTVTGKPMVEVWQGGEFIASIYAHEDGMRIVSKYLDGVEHEVATPQA